MKYKIIIEDLNYIHMYFSNFYPLKTQRTPVYRLKYIYISEAQLLEIDCGGLLWWETQNSFCRRNVVIPVKIKTNILISFCHLSGAIQSGSYLCLVWGVGANYATIFNFLIIIIIKSPHFDFNSWSPSLRGSTSISVLKLAGFTNVELGFKI